MSNGAVTFCSNDTFLSRQLFKLKVNAALKECWKIRENVKSLSKLGGEDFNVNILISDVESNNIEEKYFAFKGYNSDGSIKPLKLFTFKNGDVLDVDTVQDKEILVVDLYESSIYLHNFKVEGHYAEGFLVKNEKTKEGYNIILSTEKVKVFMKNANTHHSYKNVIEFLNGYIL
jgi:hypothetical protein